MKRRQGLIAAAALAATALLSGAANAQDAWGLTDTLEPIKGIYFFPGPTPRAIQTLQVTADRGNIFVFDRDADLLWYQDASRTGTWSWSGGSGASLLSPDSVVPMNLSRMTWVLAGGVAGSASVVYAIDQDGNLRWYGATITNGVASWLASSGNVILPGLQYQAGVPPTPINMNPANIRGVYYGGSGVFYVVWHDGTLHWFRDNQRDGSPNSVSTSGVANGTGWNTMKFIIPDVDDQRNAQPTGVIYGVDPSGNLKYYLYSHPQTGAAGWGANTGAAIGSGWQSFVNVFSGGEISYLSGHGNVIYATTQGGALDYYEDRNHAGSANWAYGGAGQAIGSGWLSSLSLGMTSRRQFLANLWTQLPADDNELLWEQGSTAQLSVLNNLVSTGANTIVMSDWDVDGPVGGPMKPVFPNDYDALFADVSQLDPSIRVLPAIEGVDGDPSACEPEPIVDLPNSGMWLYNRVYNLVSEFLTNAAHPDWAARWVRLNDRNGQQRFAINLLHLGSLYPNPQNPDNATAAAALSTRLDWVANTILTRTGYYVGFTIDPGVSYCRQTYVPQAQDAANLSAASLLGIEAFDPELTLGQTDPQWSWSTQDYDVLNACAQPVPFYTQSSYTCTDNNDAFGLPVPVQTSHGIVSAQQWKTNWVSDWVNSGIPILLDVSAGYDGHLIFGAHGLAGLYGDNSNDSIVDPWRNHESAMKRHYPPSGGTVRGMVYNAWNGFAEGLAASPFYYSRGDAIYDPEDVKTTAKDWLTSQFGIDPRYCDHQPFSGGTATGAHTFGTNCDHWQCVGGEDSYGEPITDEVSSTGGGALKTDFQLPGGDPGTIYYSIASGISHELHGAIRRLYQSGFNEDAGGDLGAIGLPVSDEEELYDSDFNDIGRIGYFEQGYIYWLYEWGAGSDAAAWLHPLAHTTDEHGYWCDSSHVGEDVQFIGDSPP